MFRKSLSLSLALLVVSSIASAKESKEIKSGIPVGDRIGAFYVVKAAGAEEDGVPEGKELCCRCKLGRRPVVAVFARTADKNLASLIHELDKIIADNEDKRLASFVNLLGEDKAALGESAKRLIADAKAANVAIVVPVESKDGPESLKIAAEADVTILIYRKGIIEVNHAFAKGEFGKESIAQVVKDTALILE